MYLNEFDSFTHAIIMNDFYNNLFGANVDLDKKRQQIKFVRCGDHFLIVLKNSEDYESNNSDARENIKSSPMHSKATSMQEKVNMFLDQQLNLHCESVTTCIRLGVCHKKKKVHHS